MDRREVIDMMCRVIAEIPPGKVAAYGQIGRLLDFPTTGRIVGRLLQHLPPGAECPWWRVVASSGYLPIGKIDPILQRTQADLLASEGVELKDGRVPKRYFIDG